MQIERVPDGRIDMKYVIYRLEEINKSEESPYIKTVLLDKFIDELLATLGRVGWRHFFKSSFCFMIKTPQKLPDVTDAGFHNPTIEVNWFYSDFVLQSITPH